MRRGFSAHPPLLLPSSGMEESMSSQVGGFQAMTQDALTVLNDVPFSIPPYFAILGRAIVTLEGIGKRHACYLLMRSKMQN